MEDRGQGSALYTLYVTIGGKRDSSAENRVQLHMTSVPYFYSCVKEMFGAGLDWQIPIYLLLTSKSGCRVAAASVLSIFAGQLGFRFLAGDFAGVAFCHDLHILIVELVAQVEEGGDHHADDGHQGVDDPQAVGGGIA